MVSFQSILLAIASIAHVAWAYVFFTDPKGFLNTTLSANYSETIRSSPMFDSLLKPALAAYVIGNAVLFAYAAFFQEEGDKVKVSRGLFVQRIADFAGLLQDYKNGHLGGHSAQHIALQGALVVLAAFMAFQSTAPSKPSALPGRGKKNS